ncbi:MAG: GH92 family glycosyl hydrolase [Kiritimatiellia bacterium]
MNAYLHLLPHIPAGRRRQFRRLVCAAMLTVGGWPCCGLAEVDWCSLVDPFIGTAGTGHTFPGATYPGGMLAPSPDSGRYTWAHCSGYQHRDPAIHGFSQTHLSGTGCPGMLDILVQPFVGGGWDYRGWKGEEAAEPGYYRVAYTNYGIRSELTVSPRVAYYRFDYPAQEGRLFLDFMWGGGHPRSLTEPMKWEFSTRIDSSDNRFSADGREIYGHYHVAGWFSRDIYYVIRFSQPCGNPVRMRRRPGERADRLTVDFSGLPAGRLEMQVAISTVSEAGARANLAAEGAATFDSVRAATRAAWNAVLGRVAVCAAPREELVKLYTALYHSFIQPANIADVDGRFRVQGVVRTSDRPDRSFYTHYSLWDTFRATHPLYTILRPELVPSLCSSLIDHAEIQGYLPVLPYFGYDTFCMVGNHAIPVLIDAYLKGLWPTDAKRLLDWCVTSVGQNHGGKPKQDWDLYEKYGYLPFDLLAQKTLEVPILASENGESVSRTLECAYDDACIARLARACGEKVVAERFGRRAGCWRNVFDRETGFARGKDSQGRWRADFDPYRHGWKADFTEGNSWQYTWHVMHDVPGLMAAMGGREAFLEKLGALFLQPEEDAARGITRLRDCTGQIGQYAHGNEPSHHIAWLFALAGRSADTHARVREIYSRMYTTADDGLCGNEDCGQMSSWLVFAALGFYPVDPCGGDYVLGAPQLEAAEVSVGPGRVLSVRAVRPSPDAVYVREVRLDGRVLAGPVVTHAQIAAGGRLEFFMTNDKEQARP